MTASLPNARITARGGFPAAAAAFLADFESSLTAVEWATVRGARPAPERVHGSAPLAAAAAAEAMAAAAEAVAAAQLRIFFAIWALKEAYIKAGFQPPCGVPVPGQLRYILRWGLPCPKLC